MTKQQTLKISIAQDGTVTEEVLGVQGPECITITENLENSLGEIQWRTESSDYYQQPNLNQDVTLQYNKDQT